MFVKQKIYTQKEALLKILSAAKIYQSELNNQQFLILAKDNRDIKYYEVRFNAHNFLHFTGMNTSLSAIKFYENAVEQKLSISNFEFKDEILTSMKLDIIEQSMLFPKTAKMIGLYTGGTKLMKVDMGAGSSHYVMTFRFSNDVELYPIGITKEDIRDVTTKNPVIAISKKSPNNSIYEEFTYKSKNINIDNLHIPKNIRDMLSDEAYHLLKPARERQNAKAEDMHIKESPRISIKKRKGKSR